MAAVAVRRQNAALRSIEQIRCLHANFLYMYHHFPVDQDCQYLTHCHISTFITHHFNLVGSAIKSAPTAAYYSQLIPSLSAYFSSSIPSSVSVSVSSSVSSSVLSSLLSVSPTASLSTYRPRLLEALLPLW
ncbi:hypothetical protein M011DRAFT_250901 [Sporormia fimetaria CBS 119925]|uniref:Uncharacterized protein n=1 Tax=Sporormia fimetaria CBS 119925 TaxID=1340428 RepID=A0A6A6V178_9PLEO|nr:hypothetical protein M011DRAFT_250901 [Sporormia fimetaria CBS 119925]